MYSIKGWYSVALCVQGQKRIKTHNLSVIGMTSEHHCLAPMFELHCDPCMFGSHNHTDHSRCTQWKQLGAKEPKVSILNIFSC